MTTATIETLGLQTEAAELKTQALAFLKRLDDDSRANWAYRVREGLLTGGTWVADGLQEGELVARTCAVGAIAPLHSFNGDGYNQMVGTLNDLGFDDPDDEDYDEDWYVGSQDDLSNAFEGLLDEANGASGYKYDRLDFIDIAQLVLLDALTAYEAEHGPVPMPELPAGLRS